MFGHRTPPTKQRPIDEAPQDPQKKGKKSPNPVAHSSHTTTASVRRSIGEWEYGKPDKVAKPLTSPKKTKPVETQKQNPKTTLSQVEPLVGTRRVSTEAAGNLQLLHKRSQKYTDRLAEAKACLDSATEHLGNSRNIKTEIKTEVLYALNQLYKLVEEGQKQKGQTMKPEQMEQTPPEGSQATKPDKDEVQLVKKLEEHSRLLQENTEKIGKLQESLDKQQEMQQKQTYANAVAALPRRPEHTALHSVVVTAEDENETGEEVLNRIRKAVNAKESGIAVEKIRKARDRKVIVGCKTDEERQRMKESLKGDGKLNVQDIKNKDPLVILKDVLKYNTDQDVLDALKNQNKAVLKDSLIDQRMEIAFKKSTRNPHTHHIVIRVSPKIWQHLVDAGSVQVDLQRVRVFDQSPLVQCSLCLGYGHGRRFCKETVEKCCHCGGPHMKSECANWLADVPPSCSNCTHAKLDRVDHNAFSSECPIRRKWEALARATIAYC